MPAKARSLASVRRRCDSAAKRMFDDFGRKRRSILTDVCREFYPIGVAGLVRSAEEVADECYYDDEHRLLTTAPILAVRNGACGFKSHLTPNAGGWFRFRPADSTLGYEGNAASGQDGAMDRLAAAVERAFATSRAYDSLYKLYEHLLVAGFGCMLVTRHPRDIVRVNTLRLGTYAMDVDDDGDVSTVCRRFSWTANQILRRFGVSSAPERVKEAAKKGDVKTRWIVHNIIEPNATGDLKAYDPTAQALKLDDSMIYRSIYWLEGAKDDDPEGGILYASGFRVKPIVAPRLDRELGDVYGRGRGIDALCAARGVQSYTYDILGVSGLRGKPPLVVSSEFKDEGFRAGRGGINYARSMEQSKSLAYPLFAQPPDTTDLRECRRESQVEINDLFFNSTFATIDMLKNNPGVKTATEIDNLVRENMERLGPIVMNLERELLDPLVSAVAAYAVAAGAPPLKPEDVEQLGRVDVDYVSRLHMAAQARKVSDIDAWVQRLMPLAETKPEILDNVNVDSVADEYARMLGVPASIRATEEQRAAIRAARQAAQEAQAAADNARQMADLARVGSVPTDKQHLGGVLKDAMEGAEA